MRCVTPGLQISTLIKQLLFGALSVSGLSIRFPLIGPLIGSCRMSWRRHIRSLPVSRTWIMLLRIGLSRIMPDLNLEQLPAMLAANLFTNGRPKALADGIFFFTMLALNILQRRLPIIAD